MEKGGKEKRGENWCGLLSAFFYVGLGHPPFKLSVLSDQNRVPLHRCAVRTTTCLRPRCGWAPFFSSNTAALSCRPPRTTRLPCIRRAGANRDEGAPRCPPIDHSVCIFWLNAFGPAGHLLSLLSCHPLPVDELDPCSKQLIFPTKLESLVRGWPTNRQHGTARLLIWDILDPSTTTKLCTTAS